MCKLCVLLEMWVILSNSSEVPMYRLSCEVSLALRALSKMFYPQTYDFKKEHLVFYPKLEMVPSVAYLSVWLGSFFFLKGINS